MHYIVLQLFLIAAFQVQLGLVPAPAKRAEPFGLPGAGGAAHAVSANASAAIALPEASAGAAAVEELLDEVAEDAATDTAVARHPAMPVGKVPEDAQFGAAVKDMIAAFFSTIQSAEDRTYSPAPTPAPVGLLSRVLGA